MRRTKRNLPDVINCSYSTNYTQIPNELLRNSNLSWKAKGLLCTLLSNKRGWKSHFETLQALSTDGESSLRSGLKELENNGYLVRYRFRSKKTKKMIGSFWGYTDIPNDFKVKKQTQRLTKLGYEILDSSGKLIEKTTCGFSTRGFSTCGKSSPKNINNKNNKIKTTKKEIFTRARSNKLSIRIKNKQYLPIANELLSCIQKTRNINPSKKELSGWANEIRILCEQNNISEERIKQVIDKYRLIIGRKYVPVIYSGSSLRGKFFNLEDAIEREKINKPEKEYTI